MLAWTPRQKELVEKLLNECEAESRHFVESKIFRKRNFSDVEDIDALVRLGFIVDQNYRYSVNVLCLVQIESSMAQKILGDADLLWKAYRHHYLDSDDDAVFLSTVATAAGVAMDDAQRAMHYMMQTSWHGGYATPVDQLYSSVAVGEVVLKYESFSDFLAHLYKQHSELPRWSSSLDSSSIFGRRGTGPDVSQAINEPDLPAWARELPEGVYELLKETGQAKSQGWNRLAAMGIRTLFDMVSTEALSGDAGPLKKKLDAMVRAEHLAPTQHGNLDAVLAAGNAAAHRGFNPTQEMVDTMWEIVLNALHTHVLRPKADKLRLETPERPPGIKP